MRHHATFAIAPATFSFASLPARLVPVEEQDGGVPATALVADLRRRATAHKAKGLEWPRVRLGADFPGLGELQP